MKKATEDFDIDKIAKIITNNPDILNEMKIRCKSCGVINDTAKLQFGKYCRACGNMLLIKTAKPITSISVDDFDWDNFSQNLKKKGEELEVSDFDGDSNTFCTTIPLKSLNQMPQLGDLYYSDQVFQDNLAKKVWEACEGEYWGAEYSTQPMGYHGSFSVVEIEANLNDAEFDGIEEDEQDDNGIVTLHLRICVPFRGRSYKDSLA